MYQACLLGAPCMIQGLSLGDPLPQAGVDLGRAFSQKDTAHIVGIVLAAVPFPADAGIHHPVVVCLPDEMLQNPGGEDGAPWILNVGVDLDSMVLRKMEDLVIPEK